MKACYRSLAARRGGAEPALCGIPRTERVRHSPRYVARWPGVPPFPPPLKLPPDTHPPGRKPGGGPKVLRGGLREGGHGNGSVAVLVTSAQCGNRMAARLRLRRESGSGCRSRGGERGRPSPPHSRLLLPTPLPPSLDGRGEMQHHTKYFRIIEFRQASVAPTWPDNNGSVTVKRSLLYLPGPLRSPTLCRPASFPPWAQYLKATHAFSVIRPPAPRCRPSASSVQGAWLRRNFVYTWAHGRLFHFRYHLIASREETFRTLFKRRNVYRCISP